MTDYYQDKLNSHITEDDVFLETQTLFDDVDRIDQNIYSVLHIGNPGLDWSADNILEAIQVLAKAIQTLRPSTSNSPTECDPARDLPLQSAYLEGVENTLTHEECDLILHMRSERLSAGKLTTVLSSEDRALSLQSLLRHLQE